MNCGEEKHMFQGPNSNKTVNIIVADGENGGFVINYYVQELIKQPIGMMSGIQIPDQYRFIMKTIVTITVEQLTQKVTEICTKIQQDK